MDNFFSPLAFLGAVKNTIAPPARPATPMTKATVEVLPEARASSARVTPAGLHAFGKFAQWAFASSQLERALRPKTVPAARPITPRTPSPIPTPRCAPPYADAAGGAATL